MDKELITIEASARSETGKSYTRKLRSSGKIPGIILEKGKTTLIEFDPKWLPVAYKNNARKFNLKFSGISRTVVVQEVQIDKVKRIPIHVDLMYVE